MSFSTFTSPFKLQHLNHNRIEMENNNNNKNSLYIYLKAAMY